jgi:hypothetical protein
MYGIVYDHKESIAFFVCKAEKVQNCETERVLQVMLPSACSFIVLALTALHYMFRPTWPSSSV